MKSVVVYFIFLSILRQYVWEADSYLKWNSYLLLLIFRESSDPKFEPRGPKFEAYREKKCRIFWEVLGDST